MIAEKIIDISCEAHFKIDSDVLGLHYKMYIDDIIDNNIFTLINEGSPCNSYQKVLSSINDNIIVRTDSREIYPCRHGYKFDFDPRRKEASFIIDYVTIINIATVESVNVKLRFVKSLTDNDIAEMVKYLEKVAELNELELKRRKEIEEARLASIKDAERIMNFLKS